MLSTSDLPIVPQRGVSRWPDILLAIAFYLLFFFQLLHHQLWRDELNAFGLALASPTLGSLFSHLRYEGHPWLWYFLLWAMGRFTASVLSIKVLEACIVAASYSLLGLWSPFSRVEKALLFAGYFISFEYAVLSRMYSLLLLLLLIYLRLRSTYPNRVIGNCVVLGLLSCADTMGLILSAGLLAEYVAFRMFLYDQRGKSSKRPLVVGVILYIAITASTLWLSRPAPDIGWRTTGHPLSHILDGGHLLLSALSFVVMPVLPVGFGRLAASFWNPVVGQHPVLYTVCFPLILVAYYNIFRGRWPLLLLMSCVLAASIAFGHTIFLGTMRHWGVTFLAFLAALWLLKRSSKPLPAIAYLLLGISALSGGYTAYAQWRRPFANAELAAATLRVHGLENAHIVGTPDTTVASLAVLLHRPIYMLDCGCSDSFVLFSSRRDGFSREQIPDRLTTARQNLSSSDFLYVDAYPLAESMRVALQRRGFILSRLYQFTGATFAEEDFYIYQVHAIVSVATDEP